LRFSDVQGAEACIFIFRFAFRSKYNSVAASEGSMRPKQPTTTQSGDLFRARLEQIINMKQELVQLAGKIVVETSDTPKLLRDIGHDSDAMAVLSDGFLRLAERLARR
jgi:hypothetical protein